jgi:hypothetical protein
MPVAEEAMCCPAQAGEKDRQAHVEHGQGHNRWDLSP